jgi:hypothetical protein
MLTLLLTMPLLAGDEPADAKPSAYAPAQDLAAQIDVFVKQIEADLANEADFGQDQQGRVAKDANTLVVLAQVLANHDEDHALRKAAPAIVTAAGKLAGAASNYKNANTALAELKQSLQSTKGGPAAWEPVAELAQLMKQVPIVNNKLRAGVTGKRFDRMLDQNAGLATTLAAIAQASLHDKAYCSDKDEEAKWARVCADMRAAASEVRVAVRKKDQSAARSGLDKLVKTCDTCHLDFRD